MDFTALVTTVNELVAFKNNVVNLSKRIFQLPISTAGQKLVAVWNAASEKTEQFDLSAALDGVYALTNRIISLGAIIRAADDFTFQVGFQWRINGNVYENTTAIERTIDGAGVGNHRIDIAVLDANNDIYIIQGFEVPLDQIVVQPPPEPDTLFLCSFIIEEDSISEPVFTETVLFLQKVRIRKGYGKFDENVNERGDIFQFGMIYEDKPVFVDFAVYTGAGDINDNNNFAGMTWKEWEMPEVLNVFTQEFNNKFS